MRYFDRLHPACAFVYFISVIFIAMLTMHPIVVTICFLTGVILYGVLCGGRRLARSLCINIPFILLMSLLNPLFSHKGNTVLLFLNDTPVTLEAIVYGIFASLMIVAVFYWFACYSEIMTSDKFIYLFGRAIPKLSLLLSITLSAVPRLLRQYHDIDDAQRASGQYRAEGSLARLRYCLRELSALVSRALEGSIDTADSMRARGYGLKGRSAYSLYRFTVSDAVMLVLTVIVAGGIFVLIAFGKTDFSYYPTIAPLTFSPTVCGLYTALSFLTVLPIMIEIKEIILWHILRSNI